MYKAPTSAEMASSRETGTKTVGASDSGTSGSTIPSFPKRRQTASLTWARSVVAVRCAEVFRRLGASSSTISCVSGQRLAHDTCAARQTDPGTFPACFPIRRAVRLPAGLVGIYL